MHRYERYSAPRRLVKCVFDGLRNIVVLEINEDLLFACDQALHEAFEPWREMQAKTYLEEGYDPMEFLNQGFVLFHR